MMQSAAVNKELCHASHINGEIMTCRQHQSLNQQYQQYKSQQKYCKDTRNEMLRFQFRIVMMPHSLQMRSLLATLLFVMAFFVTTPPVCQAVGYSYSRFSGPVTGPEQKIFVHDGLVGGVNGGGDGRPRVDYIAKPAYEFAYGIEDAQARLLQNRQETRDGDAVRGSYSVVDPDGNLRVVKYTADHLNGFQAEVTSNGLNTVVHGQQAPAQVPPAPSWYYPHTFQNQVQHPPANIEQNYNEENRAPGNDDGAGKGDYEVTEDYEENEDDEGGNENNEQHKESDGESGDNYDEHEDYDANEQSAETSKEATSYEEQSGEYD